VDNEFVEWYCLQFFKSEISLTIHHSPTVVTIVLWWGGVILSH